MTKHNMQIFRLSPTPVIVTKHMQIFRLSQTPFIMTKHNMQIFRLSPLFKLQNNTLNNNKTVKNEMHEAHLLLEGLLCPAVLLSSVWKNVGMTTTCNETGVMLSKLTNIPDPQGIHPINSQRVAATYVSPE